MVWLLWFMAGTSSVVLMAFVVALLVGQPRQVFGP